MSISFPTALDSMPRPNAGDPMSNLSHSGVHQDLAAVIEAIEAKVGINSSAATSSLDYRVAQLEARPGMQIGAAVTSGTANSVLYIDANGLLAEQNPGFTYDGAGALTLGDGTTVNGSLTIKNGGNNLCVIDSTNNGQLSLHAVSPHSQTCALFPRDGLTGGSGFSGSSPFTVTVGGSQAIAFASVSNGIQVKQSLATSGTITFIPKDTTAVPLTCQGLPGQLGNLQEWQNSSGTARVYVNSSFDVVAQSSSGNSQNSSKFTVIGTGSTGNQYTYSMRAAWDSAFMTGQYGSARNYMKVREDADQIIFVQGGVETFTFASTGLENTPHIYINAYYYQDWLGTQKFLVWGGTGVSANSAVASVHANTPNGSADIEMLDIGNAPYDGSVSGPVHYGIRLQSSTTAGRLAATWKGEWVTSTDASRKARATLTVWDTAEREGLRIESNGSAALVGIGGSVTSGVTLTVTGGITSPGAGTNSERFGNGATASSLDSLAAGNGAAASGGFGEIAIGYGAVATGTGGGNACIALGPLTSATGDKSTSIGYQATSANGGFAMGNQSVANGVRAFGMGYGTSATHDYSVCIGGFATSSAANQLTIGSVTDPITKVVFPGGAPVLSPASASTIAWIIRAASSQTANLQEWQDNSANVLSTVSESGYFTTRKTSAPADSELATGELAFWFDSTAGAAKLMVKAKNASGTVVTGSVSLT